MNQQLTMIRSAARVGSVEDVLAVADMAELLLDAGYEARTVAESLSSVIPTQGNVGPYDRLKQILEVTRAYTPDFLLTARKSGASWHALVEPARWWRQGDVQREEVEQFTLEFVERTGRWPRPDDMRRRFGYEPGHKGPGDQPGQESLGVDESAAESGDRMSDAPAEGYVPREEVGS